MSWLLALVLLPLFGFVVAALLSLRQQLGEMTRRVESLEAQLKRQQALLREASLRPGPALPPPEPERPAEPLAATTEPTTRSGSPKPATTPVPTDEEGRERRPISGRPEPRPETAPASRPAAFDWEALLGIRGAAWLGGILLIFAGSLFAKYSIDNELISPPLRLALLTALAVCALLGGELGRRRGYRVTGGAASGAAVALLYTTLIAAHDLYGLLPAGLTFALLVVTTLIAAALSLRHDAAPIAVLGLLGGFAAPVILSVALGGPAGKGQSLGLFGYTLLLDLGALFVGAQRGWTRLMLLSLVGTVLLGGIWAVFRLSPELLSISLGFALVFALLYLALPSLGTLTSRVQKPRLRELLIASSVAGLLPFVLPTVLLGLPRYAGRGPLLFGFIGCLDAAVLFFAALRRQPLLPPASAVATAAAAQLYLLSPEHPLQAKSGPYSATVLLLLTAVLFGLAPRLGALAQRLLAPTEDGSRAETPSAQSFELAAVLGWLGFFGYSAVLVLRSQPEQARVFATPWLFLLIAGGLVALVGERARWSVVERTESGPLMTAFGPGAGLLVGVLAERWLTATLPAGTLSADLLLRNLGVPLLTTAGLGLAAALARSLRAEQGAVISAVLGPITLGLSLNEQGLGSHFGAALVALLGYVVLLTLSVVRTRWTAALGGALLLSASVVLLWNERCAPRTPEGLLDAPLWYLPALLLLIAYFFAVPFALAFLRRRLRQAGWLLPTAALAGPAFFLPLRSALAGGGPLSLRPGLILVGLAGLAGLGAWLLGRLPGDERGERPATELAERALFTSVALGLLAAAAGYELEHEWLPLSLCGLGGAAAALHGLVPHRGLRAVTLLFFLAAALLLFPTTALLQAHPRGLRVLNWLLWTYGGAALLALGAAWALARRPRLDGVPVPVTPELLRKLLAFLAVLELFALLNLEILDAFARGPFIELSLPRSYGRDLLTSLSWGAFSLALLAAGVRTRSRSLRFLSLSYMLLAIAKVFLYDLSNVGGIYRPLSFLGLSVALLTVSLLYQAFVFRGRREETP